MGPKPTGLEETKIRRIFREAFHFATLRGTLEILLYLTLGLTPLLWFPHGQLITGGDIDFPLHPLARLHDRIYAWNYQFLGGTDRSLDVSTLFFTFVEAIGFALTRSLVFAEKLSFVFWFTASGLAIAYFLKVAFPGRRLLRVVGTVFYMFNFYQFYNWEIARIGELAATVEAPFLFAAIAAAADGSIPMRRIAAVVAVAALVGMGIGVQPPALFALVGILASYWLFEVLGAAFDHDGAALRRLGIVALVLPATFITINATWLLPEANFILSSGYADTSHGLEVFTIAKMLEWTSLHTSLLNNLEIAGRTVFYDGWNGEPYLPMLYRALTAPWFRAVGMLLPLAVFSALFFSRARRVWYFAGLALLTLFLSKGTHPPFGVVYAYLLVHIPGFWVLRAPWEKFALSTTIAYAVLLGVFVEGAVAFVSARVKPALRASFAGGLLATAACAAIIGFAYPLVAGASFPQEHGKPVYPGFHQTIPTYAYEAARWLDGMPGEARVLTLPDSKVSIYRWGYAAPLDITTRLFVNPIIDRQYGEGTAPPHPADQAYNDLATAIYDGDSATAEQLLYYFNIHYILQRNDIRFDFYGGHDSPSFIAQRLKYIHGLKLERRFGAWDIYRFEPQLPHVYAAARLIVTEKELASLGNTAMPLLADAAVIVPGLNVGGIQSSLSDMTLPVPVLLPHPLAAVDQISAKHPIEELRYPSDDIAGKQPGGGFGRAVDKIATVSARYFPGSKNVVSAGMDNPALTLFVRANSPYHFLNGAKTWSAADSTLVYIETGAHPVAITGMREGFHPITDLIGIIWQSGWSGMSSRSNDYPVIIPAHEHAIAQINHQVSGKLTVIGVGKTWTVTVEQPDSTRTFAGFSTAAGGSSDATIKSWYARGTVQIVTLGKNPGPFALRAKPSRRFLNGALDWSATESTLVSIDTGPAPIRITGFQQNGQDVNDLIGIVWNSGRVGFGAPIGFPVSIPAHEHAIAQINHRIFGEISVLGGGLGGWFVKVAQTGPDTLAGGKSERGDIALYSTTDRAYVLTLCPASPMASPPHATVDRRPVKLAAVRNTAHCKEFEYGPLRLRPGDHFVSFPELKGQISGILALSLRATVHTATVKGVEFARQSPVRVNVSVDGAGPFVLVFGDNYNSGWRLYKGRKSVWQILFAHPLQSSPILVNGYANGYALNQQGPETYTLFFWPQMLLAAGFGIACLSFILTVLLAFQAGRIPWPATLGWRPRGVL